MTPLKIILNNILQTAETNMESARKMLNVLAVEHIMLVEYRYKKLNGEWVKGTHFVNENFDPEYQVWEMIGDSLISVADIEVTGMADWESRHLTVNLNEVTDGVGVPVVEEVEDIEEEVEYESEDIITYLKNT